jgi:hypothetical protein
MTLFFSFFWSIFLCLTVMYFLPSLIAALRGHQSTAAIVVLNLLFGWTMLGWIFALIWSLSAVWPRQTIIVHDYGPTRSQL